MCIVSLVAPWILAKIMGYHVGEAAGLLAGSQTISAVIGVASDTINQLGISDAQKATFINAIPVAYAVTYIFGTAGSAWILASLGPKMLGGLDKVKADCKELEAQMGTSEADEPGFSPALRRWYSVPIKSPMNGSAKERKSVNSKHIYARMINGCL